MDDLVTRARGFTIRADGAPGPLITELADRIEKLEAVIEQNAMALHSFIGIIAHRFDGDGTYYWMRDPTHDEAQAAMEATNAASTTLSDNRGVAK